jgi:ribonuclease T1
MRKHPLRFALILLLVLLTCCGCSSSTPWPMAADPEPEQRPESNILESSSYSTPEDVAEYIHLFNKLPGNFITKQEAVSRGWVSSKGNLWEVTEQLSIGGDVFGNREGLLPSQDGRLWYECDVNYTGGYRGAQRIVFSNDGLIYYTTDHYKTFTQLY